MRKLLHERLRTHRPFDEDGAIFGVDDETWSIEIAEIDANHLANEIDRYYIPRPRFEDGEPVQFGDETETITSVTAMRFLDDGLFELQHKRGGHFGTDVCIFDEGEHAKRPQPKVLDADGVEIKVGDTVWTVDGNDFGKVEEVNVIHSLLLQEHKAHWFNNDQLTHKEPDSREKALKDMACQMRNWHRYDLDNEAELMEQLNRFADRLSALIERGA